VSKPELLYAHCAVSEKYGPHTWLLITLTEGKFHQVRKMMNAVHHRCKRLIRISIEGIVLGDLNPGAVREMEENDFFKKLKIENW
jgi:23S rRNA pseudouridine2457 synthase